MTSFHYHINLYSIEFDATTSTFSTSPLCSFDLRHLHERVRCIKAIFKMAEWMSTVSGPREGFHLYPGVRTQTTNGHQVTWIRNYLLKEQTLRKSGRGLGFRLGLKRARSPTVAEWEATMEHISAIYAARLPNVEWGTVEEPNKLKITRLGFTLKYAIIVKNIITRVRALADIQKGEQHMYVASYFFFLCLTVYIAATDFCNSGCPAALPRSRAHRYQGREHFRGQWRHSIFRRPGVCRARHRGRET